MGHVRVKIKIANPARRDQPIEVMLTLEGMALAVDPQSGRLVDSELLLL